MLNIPIYILKHIHYMFTLHNQLILLAENMPLMIYCIYIFLHEHFCGKPLKNLSFGQKQRSNFLKQPSHALHKDIKI